MKKVLISLIIVMASLSYLYAQNKSIYDFTVETLEGEEFSFAQLRGKKVMIVNTASKCGFTPQYEQLQMRAAEFFRSSENKEWEQALAGIIPATAFQEPSDEEVELELLKMKKNLEAAEKEADHV